VGCPISIDCVWHGEKVSEGKSWIWYTEGFRGVIVDFLWGRGGTGSTDLASNARTFAPMGSYNCNILTDKTDLPNLNLSKCTATFFASSILNNKTAILACLSIAYFLMAPQNSKNFRNSASDTDGHKLQTTTKVLFNSMDSSTPL